MISRLNMSKVGAGTDRNSGEESRTNLRSFDRGGNGIKLDLSRLQPEGRSSTPLRNHNAVKAGPMTCRDLSPRKGVERGLGEESAELRRRAEAVSDILEGNILYMQDISALQLKAIEVAERLRGLEEWYSGQLQERAAYIEHRMSRLAAASTSLPPSDGGNDKWLSPTTIRSRNNASTTASSAVSGHVSHPVTTVAKLGAEPLPIAETARGNRAPSPDGPRPRLSPQSVFIPAAASRSPVMESEPLLGLSHSTSLRHLLATPSASTSKWNSKDVSGRGTRNRLATTVKEGTGERRAKKKIRSSSATVSRGTRGAIGDVSDLAGDDDSHHRENHGAAHRRKRRSTGGSSGFQSPPLPAATTTKRPLSSSGGLVYVSGPGKCD